MSRLVDWIKSTSVRVLDPQREERIGGFARQVATVLRERKKTFDFDEVCSECGITPKDAPLVQQHLYELTLRKAWKDGEVSDSERTGLDWVCSALKLEPEARRRIDLKVGTEVFEKYLASVLGDGRIDSEEYKELQRVAATIGMEVRSIVRGYFSDWAEGLLRNVFARIVQDGSVAKHDWDCLVETATRLGLTRDELLTAIQPQARRFAEHVLADAKSDERLSNKEEETLLWVTETLKLDPAFREYIISEVRELRLYTNISEGRLPSISKTSVWAKAGEILHFAAEARYDLTKNLRSGPKTDSYTGDLWITDVRMVFNSAGKSFEVNHRNVVDLLQLGGGFQLRANGRGAGDYYLRQKAHLGLAIYRAAVQRANQTLVDRDAFPGRHISRDVRQRVWQKYGGRCAECQATQYLEFDHIIPVAKGGSNSETNVQLLCRGCNQKKSDRI